EYLSGGWNIVTMGCLEHPNIISELAGQDPPYPAAVRLSQVRDWVREWSDEIPEGDKTDGDFEFEGKWYRPGPLFEWRDVGLCPSSASNALWSNATWKIAESATGEIDRDSVPQIGCDPARFGDDSTAIHVRISTVSLSHESHNGWSTMQTASRLKQLCREL